ncbi:aspartate/glutamate racemase family protein [Robiginitalea biformata]|uniref:Putative aspartate racemase n=1 Tax=Robiginitalea biformata (strain ATCC BAA-864 / DSM 15991 / KCTC 12146 / HTCC2501) TaxID=313596 RepID=A4CJF0_ROBBH|nr:amino acid racemase [Robiginitalea biformata]EAR17058.1 putative aspartate racemase [Robiginitalea biformata HTCC2501]
MKTLGLIGGTSWHSTIEYYRCINEQVGEEIGRHANPPLILHSINIELMREQDPRKINAKYLDVAQKLEQAGAEAIVICANTPHMAYDNVQPKIGIPFLHIADATGKEAERLGLKKLGLLGNRPTMTGSFISGFLKSNYHMEVLIPEAENIGKAHKFVSEELTQGAFTPPAREFFTGQMELLRARGAEGIILGCTELPILLKEDDIDMPLLATTHLHVQMAVEFILSD